MALVLADRVRDTTTTTGTGTITLSGTAPTGYQTFGAAIGNTNTTYYTINAGSQWEVGIGTYSSVGTTLSRDTVLASSNAGALVNFATGTKDVFVTYPAEKSVNQDASGNVGIGTTSPGAKLEVNGSVRFVDSSAAGPDLLFGNIGGGTSINNVANSRTYIGAYETVFTNYDNSSEFMRITSSGNVGIGTSSPSYKLDVAGDIALKNNATYLYGKTTGGAATRMLGINGGNDLYFGSIDAAVSNINFTNNGTVQAVLTSSGNLGVGTASPVSKLQVNAASTGTAFTVSSSGVGVQALGAYLGSGVAYWGDSGGLNGMGVSTASNYVNFLTNNTERLRISAAGDVGIGTSSPGQKLVVGGGIQVAGSATLVTAGSAATISYEYPTTRCYIGDGTGYSWAFTTRAGGVNYDRVFIKDNGDVGIGTSSPGYKLSVNDPGTGLGFTNAASGNFNIGLLAGTGSADAYVYQRANNPLIFGTSNTERMRIDSSGNVGIGTTSPGAKLQVATPASGAGVIFRYTSGTNNPGLYFTTTEATSVSQIDATGSTGANTLAFAVNSTERMRIDSSGNVGIGTSSPNAKLHVRGATANVPAIVRAEQASSGNSFDYAALAATAVGISGGIAAWSTGSIRGGSMWLGVDQALPLVFGTADTERMRIDGSGNLLVGTTSNGGVGTSFAPNANGVTWISNTSLDGGTHASFRYNGTQVGYIVTSTTATTYSTSSDARLKHDIVDAPEASNLIDAIKVRSFKWNADDSEQRYGMVAQELLQVAPEAVHQPADPDQMMGVDYSKLVPMLIKEIQSLRARVAQLEGK